MITLCNLDGRLLYRNPAARTAFGAERVRFDQNLTTTQLFATLRQAVIEHGEYRCEVEVTTTTGRRWHELNLQASLDPVTGDQTILISEIDVTERRRAEQQATKLAYHDSLTGLPNRKQLQERLKSALEQAATHLSRPALLFLDLDRFKTINDSLGHSVGDHLLVEVAQRLLNCIPRNAIVARRGGDEFVLLINDVGNTERAKCIAEEILQRFAAPAIIQGNALTISTSIGISIYPEHGDVASDLMRNADTAMYSAKASGRNNYRLFTPQIKAQACDRKQIEADLRRPLDEPDTGKAVQLRVLG